MYRKMSRRGEIDGFWLFMILIFAIIPAIKYFAGDDKVEEPEGAAPTVKIIDNKGVILSVRDNRTTAPINSQVKIPLPKDAVYTINRISPDDKDPEILPVVFSTGYLITSFDKRGTWEINMYDENDLLVEWIRVTVY
jgi:hypothetical protein